MVGQVLNACRRQRISHMGPRQNLSRGACAQRLSASKDLSH
ncbi:hypothetical protein PLANPX_0686 [Lacipirellula parvula]|uniref:Uncharacterized protein n=1 Tax=Lacipirellula parvula TaxID=2650471 RepID=A0A5K7X335_9BACT|nr:hypothetical protein PLANPX_0686 [Lacipirellula parvula]